MADGTDITPSTTTILITDLVGSTELLDRLGDDAGHLVHQQHLALLRRVVAEYGGREVKALGDGLMVAFTSALGAVRCAIAMQEAVAAGGGGEQLRVGLDAGEPISVDEDLFGTPVIAAKRLCDLAGGGQILASDLVSRLVGRRLSARFKPVGPVTLKGISEPLEAVTIEWGSAGEAQLGPLPPQRGRPLAPATERPRRRGRWTVAAAGIALAAIAAAAVTALVLAGGGGGTGGRAAAAALPHRPDGAVQLYQPVATGWSAEHPCYAGDQVIFTLFTNGYNDPTQTGSALVEALPGAGGRPRTIVLHEGNAAVSAPGACFNAHSGRVAFAFDLRSTDNIWTALAGAFNAGEHQVTCYRAPYLHAGEPSFSPDGRSIVYSLRDDRSPKRATVWTVPAGNDCAHPAPPTRIVPAPRGCPSPPPADEHEPSWSPNGAAIVFQSQPNPPDGPINLWSVRPDGCGLQRITSDGSQDTDPSWSPDSRSIVYSTDRQSPTGVANLFVVGARPGTTPARLTGECYYDGAPSFSPDGLWVTFETWPVLNPSGNDIPTALWRIASTARPRTPSC